MYPGECDDGQYTDKTNAELLQCAKDSNREIKLMTAKVDGEDVSSKIVRQSTSKPFMINIPKVNIYDIQGNQTGTHRTMGVRVISYSSKRLSIGHHNIEAKVIRDPLEINLPIEHDVAKWDIQVTK